MDTGTPKTEEADPKESEVELAYKDQGYHEMEFASGNESELHEKKQQCHKNPGHVTFVPASEFTLDHLPERWRDNLVFDFISTLIGLTVRLAVSYTSTSRPPNYPLHSRRGKHNLTAYGSGWVQSVIRKYTEDDKDTCSCRSCSQTPHLGKKPWWMFRVITANHVVFDSSEARYTVCKLFYGKDEDRHECPTLDGVGGGGSVTSGRAGVSNFETDDSVVFCASHDEALCNKLEEMIRRRDDLRHKLDMKYRPTRPKDKETTMVISHPHGLCKHITIGECTGRADIYPYWPYDFKVTYSADTCPGSSGAPVFLLGQWGVGLGLSNLHITHSGCNEEKQNQGSRQLLNPTSL